MSRRREFFTRLAAGLWAGSNAALAHHKGHAGHQAQPQQKNASGQRAGVEQGTALGRTQPPTDKSPDRPAFNLPVETPDYRSLLLTEGGEATTCPAAL